MAAQSGAGLSYLPQGGGLPISCPGGDVSAPFFDVFGVKAALGRTFAAGEDEQGKEKVVVLTVPHLESVDGG